MPGEIEEKNRKDREANGIEIDDTTWQTLCDSAKDLGVDEAVVQESIL